MGSEREAALLAKLEAAEKTKSDWLRANAPGGWIDDLRRENDALRAEVESWKGLAQQFGNEADALRAKISRDTHSVTAGSCSWQSADLGR